MYRVHLGVQNMKQIKKILYLSLIIIGLTIIGCGVENNPDYVQMGGDYHPFDSVDNHGSYLSDSGFNFSECVECHGHDLRGEAVGTLGSIERSCYECHKTNKHQIAFQKGTDHSGYIQENGWEINSCFNCHSNSDHGQTIDFGGSCNSAACHNASYGGPMACNNCHGDFAGGMTEMYLWAPPASLRGEISTSIPAVGAHRIHLTDSDSSFAAVSCDECHLVPSGLNSSGHIDESEGAEVVFGELAKRGLNTRYNKSDNSCSSTYCHGESSPIWTQVDGTFNTCNSCHTMPPSVSHVNDDQCWECHSEVIDSEYNIVNHELHVNGRVETD
jgi:predicted CxxxxCH...CXXCH cytochrome family protein